MKMKNMTTKITALLLMFLLAAASLTGCFGKGTNNPTAGTSNPSDTTADEVTEKKTDNAEETSEKITNEPETEDPDEMYRVPEIRQKTAKAGALLGVAFLGYINYEPNDRIYDILFDSTTVQRYGFIRTMLPTSHITNGLGAELYAVVPVNKSCKMEIFSVEISEDGKYIDHRDSPIFESSDGAPIVLRCNMSEIYSDTLIEITDNKTGRKTSYRPMISMKDGHLAGDGKVFDFTVYEENTVTGKDVSIAWEILDEYKEVKDYIKKGMVVIWLDDTEIIDGRNCILFALGTETEDSFVREKLYGVCDNMVYSYDPLADKWNLLEYE